MLVAGYAVSGSDYLITVDLLDPEPKLTFINDSPIVSGRNIEIHLATNYDVSSLECRLETQDPVPLGDDGLYQNCKNFLVKIEEMCINISLNCSKGISCADCSSQY